VLSDISLDQVTGGECANDKHMGEKMKEIGGNEVSFRSQKIPSLVLFQCRQQVFFPTLRYNDHKPPNVG
jgi:hypothetical protein